MDDFFKGMLLGLTLAIMVGPIMIAIIQTSLEKGLKAGLTVGSGIWFSDFLFIAACFIGVKQLKTASDLPHFEITLGVAGAIILIAFGIGMIVTKAQEFDLSKSNSSKDYAGFFSKGFLVNTINPFTFFFWISVSLSVVRPERPEFINYLPFFAGIMLPIIIGDSLKSFGANWIRKYITFRHVQKLRNISGVAFIIFGLLLAGRVFFPEIF